MPAIWQNWYLNEGKSFLTDGSATIEHYSAGNQTADDHECEIRVPVIKKQLGGEAFVLIKPVVKTDSLQ